MKPLYNFGMSQEDERTEAAALPVPGARVLSIASAGDMPLSLLALGAAEVAAVDIDASQLHLLRLKLAAVQCLAREDAISFLGLMPAPPAARRRWLRDLVGALPAESRLFWQRHEDRVGDGPIWAGRYERFLRRLQRLLHPIVADPMRALLACDTVAEQHAVFDGRLDNALLRGAFRLAFHPRVFAKRGMDPRSLQYRPRRRSLGEQYFQRFRALCVATPARENHFLQLHAIGRVISPDAVPAYLAADGAQVIREAAGRLHVVHADIRDFLGRAQPASFDAVHLSNMPDWLAQPEFEAVLAALVRVAAPDARVVWRYLHVDRSVPSPLVAVLQVDAELGARLRATDRFPFYGVVPARIHHAVAAL